MFEYAKPKPAGGVNTIHAVHEIPTIPSNSRSAASGERWFAQQTRLDWQAAGLAAFESWDATLVTVARLVSMAAIPMALLLGPRGIVFANEIAARLFAGTSGAINARSVFDVAPDIAPFYQMVLDQVLSGQSVSFDQQEIRVVGEDESRRLCFNLAFTPVVDAQGRIVGALGMASDVTSLQHYADEVFNDAERLRVALEGSGMVGIWAYDTASGKSTSDPNVARMYGLSASACAVGVPRGRFMQSVHPDDREAVVAALLESTATSQPYRCRYRILGKKGQIRWVIASAKPVLDDDGTVSRMLGVIVDITDQMQTASALAESRFQFQTLTETLPQLVWSCDAEGRHDYFSARWSEFTGIAPQDITEDSWKHLVYPEHLTMVTRSWAHAHATGEPYDIDYRFRHHNGEYRWLRVMALPMRDETGRIVRWFGTSTDVHDAYLIAEERESMARELERIATEDQLTCTLTRRAFFERASHVMATLSGDRHNLALLMIDIDHFKAINDRYGHPVGDKVLAATARRIAATVRERDFVGRLGGEEFGALLPRCAQGAMREIAERMRAEVARHPVTLEGGREIFVTLSIGAAHAQGAAPNIDGLLSAADLALYRAKAKGRNRAEFADS